MEDVKCAVLAGCLLGVSFAIIKNMLPDIKIYKTFRMLMSLVLTVTIILPFINGEVEITLPTTAEISQNESENLVSELDKAYLKQIEKNISKNLSLYLERDYVSVKKLVIETYVDEYNFLEVSKVSISTDKENKEKALEIIKEHLGDNIKVEFYDEN
ncbi:MAG: hypothetical protein E7509_04620 [Ruminococcus sp.]|nr:hypothetical protein [Ruminococcus sp.]